ncbi:hypothetical protein DSY14_01205 [Nocardiopsis sp. MG754419]|nr:hypothetical protein [Nocardiopsis sp. MG754419]
MLCDIDGMDAARLRRLSPGVSVAEVESRDDGPAAAYEHAATRLLGELQRLLNRPDGAPCRVQVVCREATRHGYAGLLGMLRTATQENPAVRGQLIEFTDPPADTELAEVLRAESEQDADHLRYDGTRRQVREWEPAPEDAAPHRWRSDGVYLISGGAGGLGRLLHADILRHAPEARVVLCGRSESDPGSGTRTEYRRVDVTDAAAVADLVTSIVAEHGRLDGIVHAAGLVGDDYVIRKSHQDAQRVLAPKTAGLVNLDRAARDLPLDFLVAFSSGSGALGNAGQADYAAANGFLDAYLTRRAALCAAGRRRGRSVAIGWPLWRDGGMSVPDEELPALTERFGRPLDTDTALRALHDALALGAPQVLVRDEEDDRSAGTGTGGEHVHEEAMRTDELRARVLPRLKTLVADTVRLDADRLDAAAPLDGFGIDSLAVTRLNQRFAQWFGALPKTLFYQYPTLNDVAGHLAERHPEGCRSWLASETADTGAPARPAVDRGDHAVTTTRPRPESESADEPIAIIGLTGRYPGAPTVEHFWENLRAGRESVGEIPAERWSLDGFWEPDAQRAALEGASYSKWGAFLDGFADFDAEFFGIAPREAADMDPQERLFIESAWSVLEDAGYTRRRIAEQHDSRVGVFAGITKTGFDRHRPQRTTGVPASPRTSFASLANRVSYLLDLRGPSMPIDTMCSASLTALHVACEHLRSGACELAIAGGVNLYLHPSTYVELCRSRMLSGGEHCRSFGEGGDGFVPGEGVGTVLLKPLSRAEADGDPIRAVILGSAINHGGRGNGYTVPNPRAQAALVRQALDHAGLAPDDIGYIEAHGTGTRLGDPIEIDGLTQVFGPDAGTRRHDRCSLGSVKSNIGHLEAAAGIAGLTKVVLQLQHGEFAPTLHAERPNPDIDFEAGPFALRTSGASWTRPSDGGPRRAGVSSFGAGGANAHVILAEYEGGGSAVPAPTERPLLLPLSARTSHDLHARVDRMAAWLGAATDIDLPAVAATLQEGREAMDERLCFIASTPAEWREQLHRFLASPDDEAPWHRGRVRATREALAALEEKEELRALVDRWAAQGELHELAAFWAKGMPLDWERLRTDEGPRPRVHLPGYPFAGRRFWFDPFGAEATDVPEVPAAPAATTTIGPDEVERLLFEALGEALQMPAAEIERRRPFADYGLDSILGVNLVHTVNAALGTALETTDLFDHGTIDRLRTFISRTYGDTLHVPAPAAPAAPSTAATSAKTPDAEDDAIAVVGMAARYSDAEDPQALWDHLVAGHDLVEPVTRWELAPDVDCRSGSFIRDIDRFDPVFFGISGVEATYMDPQQRVFLEQCWNALEDAGYTGERLRDRNCGVYVGCYAGDYHDLHDADAPAQALWGAMGSIVASRIAYQLDLRGPALATDTSCSSSLVSLHLACRDLRSGAADMAIAGGVFVQATPRLYRSASRAGMLSSSGRCSSFDESADGFVPGEGAGAVLLKRLADAERDGDHVYGVVRASGINQDGTTNGLTAPSAVSQERLLKEVYAEGGIEPGGIQLLEAHGTGTPLGDPIEFRALTRAFEGAPQGSAFLGSIKTNIGHTQFAAGIAGVIKSLLALRHRRIPPSLHFERANPRVALEGGPFTVPTSPVAWETPAHGPRRAAVSSFGASGTNAHVVVEEHTRARVADPGGPYAFLLSGRTPQARREVVTRLSAHLDREPEASAGAVAYSLAAGRSHFPYRLAVVASDLRELSAHLRSWLDGGSDPSVLEGATVADPSPSDRRPSGPDTLARAYVHGEVTEFADGFPHEVRFQVPLPTYPFERQRYWVHTDPATRRPAAAVVPGAADTASVANPGGQETALRIQLSGEEYFLADHHVGGRAVLPAVLSLEFARRTAGPDFTPLGLRDVVWPAPFPVGEDGAELTVVRAGAEFRVLRDGDELHAQGRVEAVAPVDAEALETVRNRCTRRRLTRRQVHTSLEAVGIRHGHRLRAIDTLDVGDGEVLAGLVLPEGTGTDDHALHPAMVDSAIQAVVGLYGDENGGLDDSADAPALPFALDRVDVLRPTTSRMWAHLRWSEGYRPDSEAARVDIDLYDEQGRPSVSLRGYTSRSARATDGSDDTAGAPGTALLAPVWDALPTDPDPRPAPETGRLLVIGGSEDERTELRRLHPGTRFQDHTDQVGEDVDHVVWVAPHAHTDDALFGLFALVKTLLATGADARELSLTVVTRRGRMLPGDETCVPAHAGAHGLIGTVAKEYPHWSVRGADIDGPVPWRELLALPADPRGETLGLRRGEWYRQRLLEVPDPGTVAAPPRPRGVLVAIGGAGGIGTVWTEHVARRHDARVVWIGRRPHDADIAAKQDSITGPRPGYVQADATDPEALRRARDEIVRDHGPIRGVLHTAIVLGDRTLARMSEEGFRTTYTAKAAIARNIGDVFAGQPLDFVGFFSSMQAFFKAPGQANYAAGCTYADAFAELLDSRLDCPVKVVNWGYWAGVGVVTADGYRQRMARLGIGSIGSDEGMAAFDALLASPYRQLAVLKATDASSIDGIYGEDALTHPPVTAPSLIASLWAERPDRAEEIARVRSVADGHAASMHDALLRITWALLRSMGLFADARSATAREWRAVCSIEDRYQRWMEHTLSVLADGGHLVAEDGHYRSVDTAPVPLEEAWLEWERARSRWDAQEAKKAQAHLVDTTLRALPDILTGHRPATDVMFPNSSTALVESVYKNNPVADHFNEVLADTLVDHVRRRLTEDPAARLRILEIGAGTGGTSAVLFRRLAPWAEHIETYAYTDISKAFLLHARREYSDIAPYLDGRLFNAEKPLAEQDLEPGSFDVVVATNVLHATRNIRRTLRNAKAAAKPHALLLLNELSDNIVFSHLTFGLLDGWWLYDDPALRIAGSPGLTSQNWLRALSEVGFRSGFAVAEGAEDLGQQVFVAESDGVVRQPRPDGTSKLRGSLPEADATQTSAAETAPAPTAAPRTDGPTADGGERLFDAACDYFRAMVAEVLQLPVAEVRADVSFDRYGIDSILVVQLTDAVRRVFDNVGGTLFFQVRDITGLVRHFLDTEPETLAAVVGPVAEPRRPAPERTGPSAEPIVSAPENAVDPSTAARTDDGGMAIAIVGMAGRYPGARDLDAFWDNLVRGRDCVTEIPTDRWDHDRFYHPRRGVKGRTYSKWGGFLDGVDEFDPLFFGISPAAASKMDPQERLFLQTAHATLEDAGYTRDGLKSAAGARVGEDAGDIGVYVGAMYSEYQLYGAESTALGRPVVVPGSLASIANQVSYFFDATGPSLTVDTMCASSLTAIHHACAAIERGECGAALAGGVNLSLHPGKYLMIGESGFASSDGRCRSFGADGDGYVPGEGVGAVLLRPLSDALADGDRVLGVIRGTALNHGGRTHGFTVPHPQAQASVIRAAWRRSDVDPRRIGYVEAHGTGTPLGDPIEIAGLTQAFGAFTEEREFCGIGSAKSNLGHLESAAGIAGLSKLLLQIRHGRVVPSLHAERSNPEIDWAHTPFVLDREGRDWPRVDGRPRVGALSAFGAGGSNAHLLVEEHTEPEATARPEGPFLLVLSALDTDRLRAHAARLRDHLRGGDLSDADLADIAHTLQVGREPMRERFAVVVGDLAASIEALDACAEGRALPAGASRGTVTSSTAGSFVTDADLQDTLVLWLRRGKLSGVAEAWTSGATVDWARAHEDGPRPRRIALPTYPFARERYWYTDLLDEVPDPVVGHDGATSTPGTAVSSTAARRTPEQTPPAVVTVDRRPGDAAPQRSGPAPRDGGPRAAASHEIPAGDVTLHPVWEPAQLLRGRPFPAEDARVVAIGLDDAMLAATRESHANTRELRTDAASVERVREELAALAPFDHVVLRFPGDWPESAADRIAAQREVTLRMFRVLRALTTLGGGEQRWGITLVTSGAFAPDPDEPVDPVQASLHGLIGGLAKEQPHWRLRAVDLADGEPFVPRELFALPADRRVHPFARRGGQYLRRRLIPVAPTPEPEPVLRRDGVYVLIGGAGDLGVMLTEYLIREVGAHVVWVGRRPEDEHIRAKAAGCADAGRVPAYLSADASDADALAAMRDETIRRHGRIDGVFHLAMVFSHTPLAEMTETEVEATLGAKVDPCVHFADVFARSTPGFILLVSSLVSFIRNADQAHYSAACAFEDARAAQLAAELDIPVKVVNWGYWGNVPDDLLQAVTEMGLAPIDPAGAMGAIRRLLAGPLDQVGFMRLGRPLPVEGTLTEEVLEPRAELVAAPVNAVEVPVPAELAAVHEGTLPAEVEAFLCRRLAAELRAAGIDPGQAPEAHLTEWHATTFRVLTEHGLVENGRWSPDVPADPEPLRAAWADQVARVQEADPDLTEPLRLLGHTLPVLGEVIGGRVTATDVLFPNGSFERVEGVYRANRVAEHFNAVLAEQVTAFLRARREAAPDAALRVLEIGAGTGGTTVPVLERLERVGLDVAEYCFTDLSQAFLQNAQDTFGQRRPYLSYRVFDAARAPQDQGLDVGSFDVVIAANVLHATENIRPTLRGAKALLGGGGLLALNEITGFYLINHLTFGLLDGWWLHDDPELRVPGSPALSPRSWRRVLRQEGFTHITEPAADALALGQQIVTGHSDGLARGPRVPAEEAPVDTVREETVDEVPAASVADVVLTELAAALRVSPRRIDPEQAFADYGLDSIVGASFVQRLNTVLGVDVLTTVIFDHRSVRRLAEHLVAAHGARAPRAAEPSSGAAPGAGASDPVPAAGAGSAPVRDGGGDEPIAIIGMSGRFAGSPDLDALWRHLADGDDMVGPIERWDLSEVGEDELSCRSGSFLDGIDEFDARLFNLTGLEATYTDPQQRLFLEQAWSALENAGHAGPSLSGSRCGVYVGCTGGDYDRWFDGPPPAQAAWGNAPSVVPARIAYHLDLQGPAVSVDTACSSSLVAVHLACQSLRSGETELALAGGVSVQTTPETHLAADRGGMLSPTGRCRTFDADADGFVPGEGVGVVVLKRLSDAIADGDHVHAVIRGSAVNQDGASNGITAPSALSQERLIRQVHEDFDIDPAEIGMVEAHGTGTRLGDPIECQALVAAFGQAGPPGSCALGSIKTNLGHTTSAAGVAGLLKAVLSLRHEQIPPSLHFHRLNPAIRLEGSPFTVNTRLAEWRPNHLGGRVAAVSAFGFSGTNAHLVVEGPPARTRPDTAEAEHVFPLSARGPEALRQRVTDLAEHLRRTPEIALADVSHTLAVGREHYAHRAVVTASSHEELVRRLEEWPAHGTEPGGIAARYLAGENVDFAPLFAGRDVRRVPLPATPFQRKRYWPTGRPRWGASAPTPDAPVARTPVSGEPRSATSTDSGSVAPPSAHRAVDDATSRAGLEERVLDELSRVLMIEPDEIDPEASFSDFGVDSVLSVRLVGALNTALGVELANTALFEHSTLRRITAHLLEEYGEQVLPATTDAAGPEPVTEAATGTDRTPVRTQEPSDGSTDPVTPTAADPADPAGGAGEDDAIAVVGLAARFADSPDAGALWRHLADGDDLVDDVTRWDLTDTFGERRPQGSLLDDIARFDAWFFRMSGKEAACTDPQQRIFLEECWHALEDAGYAGERLDGRGVGVYAAGAPSDYQQLLGEDAPPQTLWGNISSVIASRISYFLDLQGPALSVDTACSSSLMAIHQAARDLRDGETDMALAGGVFVQSSPAFYRAAHRAGMLSPTGRCHTFDAAADGFVPGEGSGVVVLKRVADAVRDGDHIHGVLRASGTNQDGTTNGLTAPSARSQARLLRRTHERAGIDPAGIGLVEAHGTGTALGDPIEFSALRTAFGDAPVGTTALGSIKTNIGHTQFAAGVASVLKVLLALEHGQLPPSLHFEAANPAIALDDGPFYVNTELRDWPAFAAPRRAAVSSFGASGTNVHAVFEQAPAPVRGHAPREAWLIVVSGQDDRSREAQVRRLLDHLRAHPETDLGDVAFTLATGRRHCSHRFACVVRDRAELIRALSGEAPELVVTGASVDHRPDPVAADRAAGLVAGAPDRDGLLELAGLFTAGTEIRFVPLFGTGFGVTPLPGYAFAHERYWSAPSPSVLSGTPVAEDRRRVELTGREFFLDDHRVRGEAVLPGVAYLETALALGDCARLRDVVWSRPARVHERTALEAVLVRQDDGTRYEIASEVGVHAHGRIDPTPAQRPEPRDLAALRAACDRTVDHRRLYRDFDRMGVHYGPAMRGVAELFVGDGLAVARLELPDAARDGAEWRLHPAMLDAAVQTTLGLSSGETAAALPFVLEELRFFAPAPATGWAVARPSSQDPGGRVRRTDIDLCDDEGTVCVRLLGLSARVLEAGPELVLARNGLREAEPVVRPGTPVRHDVLLAGVTGVDPDALAAALGVPCSVLQDRGDGPGERFTAAAEALLAHIQGAVRATRDGRVLVQVVCERPFSGLSGLLRTARMEHPKLVTQLVEVEPGTDVARLDTWLRYDAASHDDAFVRHEGGRRLVPERTEVATDPREQEEPWRSGGVYLVTGGAGGLGAVFARHIASRAPGATLVLCGRSDESDEHRALLAELTRAGASATYRVLDVSVRADVEDTVRTIVERHGRLDGVVHAAGTLRDGYLATKTAADLRAVFAAKVAGTIHLDEATADLDLDCFLAFSSLSALGNPGQADYAAAHAFLGDYAEYRAEAVRAGRRSGRTLEIAWPLWESGGMGVDTATGERMHRSVGMVPMPDGIGVEALLRAYATGETRVSVIYGDRARVTSTLLSTADGTRPGDTTPEDAESRPVRPVGPSPDPTEATGTDPGRPDPMSAHDRASLLWRVREHAAAVCGVPTAEIDPAVELTEYGFDLPSLTALADAVGAEFGRDLSPFTFTHHPTLEEAMDHLIPSRPESGSAAARPTPGPETADTAETDPGPSREDRRRALLAELTGRVSTLLDVPASRITAAAEFTRYGFDSLSLTGFADELNTLYGLRLVPTVFFEHPTLGEIADLLLDEYGVSAAAAAPRQEPRPTAETTVPGREPEASEASESSLGAAPSSSGGEPIAIVGISARFPQADGLDEYWGHLRDGRDCTRQVPADRWDWRAYYGDPVKDRNASNVIAGGFMDGVGDFDPKFFDLSPKEAELMDPQQRLLMLHTWKALEDAGYAAEDVAGTDTALIAGTTSTGYSTLVTRYSPAIEGYDITGASPAMGPNRTSFFLDLHGPSEPVDTACSSALVAMHRAVHLLRSGASDMAIAAGVNTIVSVDGHISISKAGMLSPEGKCKTFSDGADGYARGEGVGVVVLKRLADAERDGDHVYGLIRGTSENHGGRASSLTAPNPKAQASLLRDAYTQAGVDPRTVGYVEAHGTGTRLGDPVEINGLKKAFAEMYAEVGAEVETAHVGVGSVKTNIGHLELAAGVAGVIKVLLQMKHRKLVPSLHCDTVNPYIDLTGSPLYLVRELQDWRAPRDADGRELPRRAGVSSFGFGGVNAHVVLEEYVPRPTPGDPVTDPVPVVLSAAHPEVLRELVRHWVDTLDRGELGDTDLADIARTTQTGRTPMAERLAVLARDVTDLRGALDSWLRGDAARVITGRVARDTEPPAAPEAEPTSPESLHALLEAWVRGADVDWSGLHEGRAHRRLPLPTYPFRLRRYWVDTTTPVTGQRPLHPMLHRNTSDLEETRFTVRFTGREPFLTDHRVQDGVMSVVADWRPGPGYTASGGTGVPVLPAVASLELARAAAVLAAGGEAAEWSVRLASWRRPLVVDTETDVHVALRAREDDGMNYSVYTEHDGERTEIARGQLRRRTTTPERWDLEAARAACDGIELDGADCYARFTGFGMSYGPALRGVERLYTGSRMAMARLRTPAAAEQPDTVVLNPSVLDAALQATTGLFLDQETTTGAALPYTVAEVRILSAIPRTAWAVVRFNADDNPGALRRTDVDVCADDGTVCVRLRGLTLRTVGEPLAPEEDDDEARLLQLFEAVGAGDLSAAEFKRSLS